MRRSRFLGLSILWFASLAGAQVVAPIELHDADMHALQQQYLVELKAVGQNITNHHFDFPFYFSRKLDIDEKQQKRVDQHSIRFEHFEGMTVLAISGNYYGAYASEKFDQESRARQTFLSVILPIVKAAVPAVRTIPQVQGYAIEVSHHVYSKSMGMPIERAENLMVYLPQDAAIKLVAAQGKLAQQVALLEAEVFLNANPLSLWLTDEELPPGTEAAHNRVSNSNTALASAGKAGADAKTQPPTATAELDVKPTVASQSATPAQEPARDTSPQALAALQTSIQDVTSKMLKELEPQAHFVKYAPPAFIAFRNQAYLELSVDTVLPEPSGTSRYKLAALAFDDHISPLIRRVLTYFPGDQNFDGISFSTTVHTGSTSKGSAATTKSLSVEYFLSLRVLHCYESYECTGQQLLDAGTVLMNGERTGLDLQMAEGVGRP